MKKLLTLLVFTFIYSSTIASECEDVVVVDCFQFADTVEGASGDAGDADVWWEAFVYCSGVDVVVIGE